MEKIATVFLDLDKIADSGQCFRWREVGDREYIIPAFGKELHIKQDGPDGWLEFDCSREEYETVWADYFDLKTNYARYTEELRTIKVPEYLREAEAQTINSPASEKTLTGFIEELSNGRCKGVKSATAFKIEEFARTAGYIV